MKRVAVLSLVLGCASTVGGSRGDAGDAAAVAPTNLDLTVLLWARTPGAPGVGVAGRAQADDGTSVEGAVGADGHLRLNLDPARRYNVTVAARGWQVVSLLGVRAPFASTIRLMPRGGGARPPDVTVRTRTVLYRGRASPNNRVAVEGGFSDLMTAPDRTDLVVEDWPAAPTLSLAAIEYGGPGGSTPVNARWLPGVARAADGVLTVDLPAPPTPVMTGASVLEFPSVGLVTGAMPWVAARTWVIQRKYTATGDRPATVGVMQLEPPSERRAARLIVTSFDGPLRPQWVIATLRLPPATADSRVREVTVATRPPFAGLAIAVPFVQTLGPRHDPTAPGRPDGVRGVRLDASTDGWHRAAFVVGAASLWEGFAVDGEPWRDRPLPALPSSLPASALFGETPAVQTCLLRDDPNAVDPPWAMAPLVDADGAASLGRSLVRVCFSEPATR